MADNSQKQLLGVQLPLEMRPRSNSAMTPSELMKRQPAQVRGIASDRRSSIASSIGSCTDETIRMMEEAGELEHQGEDVGQGKVLLSLHYSRDLQIMTVKVIQAKELRSPHGNKICAFVTLRFLPNSSTSRLETRMRMLTSNPVWKEAFRISNFLGSNFREHKALAVEVWDKLPNGCCQPIGEAIVLLRSLAMDDIEKGIVLWKYLNLDRHESELSLGEVTITVKQGSRRKKQLSLQILGVTNAAIPVTATSPCLYVKLELLRGDTVVLAQRTGAVSNSCSPTFNHKSRLCLDSGDLRSASLKLLLRQETGTCPGPALSEKLLAHCQKTVGVVHLSESSEREDLRDAWRRMLACGDKKLSMALKFSAPPRAGAVA